jgi:hypothetical protein
MIETRQGERGETGRQYLQTSEEEDKLFFGWKGKRSSGIVMAFWNQQSSLICEVYFEQNKKKAEAESKNCHAKTMLSLEQPIKLI